MIRQFVLSTIGLSILGMTLFYVLSILFSKGLIARGFIDELLIKPKTDRQIVYVYDWHKTIALLILVACAAYGFLFMHDLHIYMVTREAVGK